MNKPLRRTKPPNLEILKTDLPLFLPLFSLYPTPKFNAAAVYQFCRSIGQLYAPKIRVHSVCPGAVTTPLAQSSFTVPGNEKFANSREVGFGREPWPTLGIRGLLTLAVLASASQIKGSQSLLFPDDIADAMLHIIDNDSLEPGVGIQAYATGLEVLKTETVTVMKIKDVRKREGNKAKM